MREMEELRAAVDQENRAKQDSDKQAKSFELQLAEVQSRCDEQVRQLSDFQSMRGRLGNENNDLARQLEDLESQLAAMQRLKMGLTSQLEEARRTAEDESKVFFKVFHLSQEGLGMQIFFIFFLIFKPTVIKKRFKQKKSEILIIFVQEKTTFEGIRRIAMMNRRFISTF